MKLQRGFKSHAIRIGRDLRTELRLSPTERLDPLAASEDLGIPVYGFSKLLQPNTHEFETMVHPESRVSAFTIFLPAEFRVFCYNDSRASTRIASDVAHELAHALLRHPPHMMSDLICTSDPEVEAEAAYLAGVLLVPDEAAMWVIASAMDMGQASMLLGVSRQMLQYRINVSGASRRVQRSRGNFG